jgi:hypothetical protein
MNEAASSIEPKVKIRFATVDDAAFERPQMQFPVFNNCSNITINYSINWIILFVKILNLYSFFLNQFYCFETLEMSSFKNWCWFEAATYKKE